MHQGRETWWVTLSEEKGRRNRGGTVCGGTRWGEKNTVLKLLQIMSFLAPEVNHDISFSVLIYAEE